MKRKRSRLSRQPRANSDALFQSYFGWLSLVEPFDKQKENENVRDAVVASDRLRTDNKLRKLKLKFGGITRTIHANKTTEAGFTSGTSIANSSCSDGPKSKDDTNGNEACPFDISDGLVPTLSKNKKGSLSEMEKQLKKAEAAQRRKIQSEKAASEAEAAAIRKILGQDSGRKKREEMKNKHRNKYAEEKSCKSFNLGSNTVRLTMGPQGTVVTFSEDIGLPSIFQMIPNSYPPPREKCAGPNCTNVYKYRDSKSKLPLCSLGCYKAIHMVAF